MQVSQESAGPTYRKKRKLTHGGNLLPSRGRANVSPGLKRYMQLRGTPRGVYEVVRMVQFTQRIGNSANAPSGLNFPFNTTGTTAAQGFTFVFFPDQVQAQDSTGGNLASVAIPNYTELSAVWDNVKLDKVEVIMSGAFTQVSGSLENGPCTFLVCSDDNSTDTSKDIMLQDGATRQWVANNTDGSQFKYTLRPKYQQLIYFTALTSGYEPKSGYIRSDYSIPHYGLKVFLCTNGTSAQSNPVGMVSYYIKYYYKFKDLK